MTRTRAAVTAIAAAVALTVALTVATERTARAEDEALVRVISEEAQVHTGPGFGFRVVYIATRGEVLPAIGRANTEHWFRVRLPDGTYGWVLGDEVYPLDIETSDAARGPSLWGRISDAVFSPSPLLSGRFSLSFSAGVIGGDSAFIFRPAMLFEPHVAVEGFVGETVGNQVDVIYYGVGPNVYVFPSSPVTPFLAAAGGGATSRRKADQFAIKTGTFAVLNVGGGLIIALKKRITLRGDARYYVVFDPNHTQRIEEYSGALNITF